jgi:hypothetical protein
MHTNKSPFEIRLDILLMAKEMLDREHDTEHQLAYALIERIESLTTYTPQETLDNLLPKMYSSAKIVEKAGPLLRFVQNPKPN